MAETVLGGDVPDEAPSLARIYDYLLGGYHNFSSDRAVADDLIGKDPEFPLAVRANRAFLRRCVQFLCQQGIDQFLDLGSGIPTVGNVHEVAQQFKPAAHVVYVEIDPVAVRYSLSILRDQPTVTTVEADVFQPETVLSHPEVRRLIDFDRPLAILMLSVLHFLPDDARARQVVRVLRDAIPSGSYLALSHGTVWLAHPTRSGAGRSRTKISAFFKGLELVEPGLVYTPLWRPEDKDDLLVSQPERSITLGGVARKP
jgi:hypothetical protein